MLYLEHLPFDFFHPKCLSSISAFHYELNRFYSNLFLTRARAVLKILSPLERASERGHDKKGFLPEDDPIGFPPNESKDTKFNFNDQFK